MNWLAAAAGVVLAMTAQAQLQPLRASNVVPISPRVVTSGQPDAAVSRVWVPRGVWNTFLREQLRQAKIAFEPS